jgi:DNA-binding HxlR family transcriptional regulator
VDYSLTGKGNALIPILEAMCDWGIQNLGVIPRYRTRTPVKYVGPGERFEVSRIEEGRPG